MTQEKEEKKILAQKEKEKNLAAINARNFQEDRLEINENLLKADLMKAEMEGEIEDVKHFFLL